MPIPGVTFAEWLRSEALYAYAEDAGIAASWGDDAPKSERITALASSAAATAEASRQLAFMNDPMAREQHTLKGRMAPYIGKTITLKNERLGYVNGLNVLVLSAQDDLGTGMSTITVLRRLT